MKWRAAVIAASIVLAPASSRADDDHLRVLVPDADNLQYMAFWVARAGGHFAREHIAIELVVPPGPQQTSAFFSKHDVEAAVLPPPVFVSLVAEKEKVVLVANLLANDPIDLVVRKSVLEARAVRLDAPLRDRLVALRGIKLGIAPHPPTRLRALYASVGLDADKDVAMEILHGKEQNRAFTDGEVDGLYAHTPYLERAIVHDGAVVVVDQARGDVPELANRQIHGFAFRSDVVRLRPELVERAVRAIAAAEASIHASRPMTVDVLASAFPKRDRRELETIVRLYEPAIPRTPAVTIEGVAGALIFYPAGMKKPDLAGIDLSTYVAPRFAAPKKEESRAWIVVAIVGALVVGVLAYASRRRVPR